MRPTRLARRSILTVLALAALTSVSAGCQHSTNPTTPPPSTASSPATTPATIAPQPTATTATPAQQAWPTSPRTTAGTGGLLVAIRAARHPGYDRVVFEFRDGLPPAQLRYAPYILEDPRGGLLGLQGRAFLQVVFQHASTVDQNVPTLPGYRKTYTGPTVITTGFPSLAQVRLAGDFEMALSFGLGLQRRVGFRVLALADPPRLVIDVAYRPAPPVFAGIWPFASQRQAGQVQWAVAEGHQPWLLDASQVAGSLPAARSISSARRSARLAPAPIRSLSSISRTWCGSR
jgi:hypothetical protein